MVLTPCAASASMAPRSSAPAALMLGASWARGGDFGMAGLRLGRRVSAEKLLFEHAFFQVELSVEQLGHRDIAVLPDLDRADVAHLGEIGDRADRPLVGFERVDPDLRAVRQQRAAPPP